MQDLNITPESLEQFKKEAFICYANAQVNGVFVQLGVNANGEYVAIYAGYQYVFLKADKAVSTYQSFLNDAK